MIEAKDLTKRYGDTLAVDDLSFTVHPGVVTGFNDLSWPLHEVGAPLVTGLTSVRRRRAGKFRHPAPPRRHKRFKANGR
jgi:ABC-type phosphonate transport system ATPase subunit